MAVFVMIVMALVLALWIWLLLKFRRLSTRMPLASTLLLGPDGRFSLSRVQAGTWTLVVVLAWIGMSAVRYPAATRALTDSEHSLMQSQLETVNKTVATLGADVAATALARAGHEADKARIQSELISAQTLEALYAANKEKLPQADADKGHADSARISIEKQGESATNGKSLAEDIVRAAQLGEALKQANAQKDTLERDLAGFWVGIPTMLLTLMGVSLGTAAASSLITAQTPSGATPQVDLFTLQSRAPATPEERGELVGALILDGSHFDAVVQARLNYRATGQQGWKSLGIVTLAPARSANRLTLDLAATLGMPTTLASTATQFEIILDAADAKVVLQTEALPAASIGTATDAFKVVPAYPEMADLFIDDNDPRRLDFSRVQSLLWTLALVTVYIAYLYQQLGKFSAPPQGMLPDLPQSLAWLTVLSSGSYLATKVVKAGADRS